MKLAIRTIAPALLAAIIGSAALPRATTGGDNTTATGNPLPWSNPADDAEPEKPTVFTQDYFLPSIFVRTPPGARSNGVADAAHMIQDCVTPDAWVDRGGAVAHIVVSGGRIRVTHTAAGHREVARLLGVLRNPASDLTHESPPAPRRRAADPEVIIPELSIDRLSPPLALVAISRASGCNIVIGADSNDLGVAWAGTFSMHLSNVTVGQAINAMLIQSNRAAPDTGYRVHGDSIEVCSHNLPPADTEPALYDLRSLIDEQIRVQRPRPVAGANGGSLSNEIVAQLLQLITSFVDTDGWVDNGGNVGRAVAIGDKLLIIQTPKNHRRIARLLRDLRDGRSRQDADGGGAK